MERAEKMSRIVLTLFIAGSMIYTIQLQGKIGFKVAIPLVLQVVAAGHIIAPILANYLGSRAGETLFSGSSKHIPTPQLSAAETAFKNRNYSDSLTKYRAIQEEFPEHLPLYRPLFQITLEKLHDLETARAIYKKGWMVMNEEGRKKLERLYNEYAQQLKS